MCIHLWMNLIKRTIDIEEKLKILKIYVQSQWRAVLLWYPIFWQSSIQRGRHTQLCIITSLKWIIQICSTFTVGFVKLLSTHPIHIDVWGNFPFKKYSNNLKFKKTHASRIFYLLTPPPSALWSKINYNVIETFPLCNSRMCQFNQISTLSKMSLQLCANNVLLEEALPRCLICLVGDRSKTTEAWPY